ncbi:Synaptotagmin-like protein 5, partial [Anthophora retusa]
MSTTDVFRIAQQGPTTEEEQGRLKADLQYLRRRGLLKASGELSYQGRKCTRCGAPFGKFYNTGASCTRCRHRVCRQCRIEVRSPTDNKDVEWICNVCYKIAELHIVTGKWTYENSVSKGSIHKKTASPVEILKHSIRRAWTINGPPTRWSAARKSPELRIYRSLPSRHQEYREIINKNEIVKPVDRETSNTDQKEPVVREANEQSGECNGSAKDDPYKDATVRNETILFEKCTPRVDINERTNTKRGEKLSTKQEEEVPSSDAIKIKRNERHIADNKTRNEEQDESTSTQEQTPPRISLIKPPKILTKFISPEFKSTQVKHGERKSNIPIFKRSSKEFEDIRSPQESPKRSLIPQRYRGSTDDLRRSREDISVPSLIPKLISPRNKEDRLKRQDSKDDIRYLPKSTRKESKEETRSNTFQSTAKEDSKHGIRLFRRDNSREDVGRESANSNANSAAVAAKGKQAGKEEKQERTEERVGVSSTLKSKSTVHEQGRTKVSGREGSKDNRDGKSSRNDGEEPWCVEQYDRVRTEVAVNEQTMLDVVVTDEKLLEEQEGVKKSEKEVRREKYATEVDEEDNSLLEEVETLENNKNGDCFDMKETAESSVENSETDGTVLGTYERKDTVLGRKLDDFQVVRRKFSKEEFSNPDDTDDTPNKRCSSHLSPEASPLSTRSSRYSPRESESEPTPALPRKTADSCSASQRIRDAITRTRRESNSSARYESSGSESVRLSEIGLHGYVELARKVNFFSGSGNGTIPSTIGSDEVVQRDSATSAGEDEPHDDNHGRTGPVSSQGRSMLRRRRQFDAQGSRRRGRSHARTCCAEELQGFQTLHVIGRDGRQHSPTGNQVQDQQPLVDYRRLVFISSDSSSGREEDDADSSCSSSSFLNGLPRAGSHTQSLEDCDWDYFESGSLPLPIGVPITIGTNNVGTDTSTGQDWSCCPGRGSTACQACGGSRGANVLPVPVPIPVPVPYPVPVPAALWTSDFAAAASSMISRSSDAHAEPGTLRLRGDPAAPWFAWHPRFNQPLHGTRLDPRLTGAFDPTTCTFRPDQVLAPPLYRSTIETSPIPSTEELHQRLNSLQINQDENDDAGVNVASKSVESFQDGPVLDIPSESKTVEQSSTNVREKLDDSSKDVQSQESYDDTNETKESEETSCQDSVSVSFESRRGQRMYQHEDSGSSSGRSSADSSDLEEDSSSHRFSRVFVVNDDSLTSDNDIEDNGDEDEDSDSVAEDSVTLKRVTALPDGEPVVLQYVRFLNEDSNFDEVNRDRMEGRGIGKGNSEEEKTRSSCKEDVSEESDKSTSDRNGNVSEKRKHRGKRNSSEMNSDKRISLSLQQREMPEEMYIASDNDCSEHQVELKSIKTLDPDSIEPVLVNNTIETDTEQTETTSEERLFERIENDSSRIEEEYELTNETTSNNKEANLDDQMHLLSTDTWDSNIIPDSLEISGQEALTGHRLNAEDNVESFEFRVSTPLTIRKNENVTESEVDNDYCVNEIDNSAILSQTMNNESVDQGNDNNEHDTSTDLNSNLNVTVNVSSGSDSFTSNETNATGSEVSSDELHEYEVTSANVSSSHYENEFSFSTLNNSTLLSKLNKRNEERTSSNRRDIIAKYHKDNDRYNEPTCVTASSKTKWNEEYEKAIVDQSTDNINNDGVATTLCTESDSMVITAEDDQSVTCHVRRKSARTMVKDGTEDNDRAVENHVGGIELKSAGNDVGDIITNKIQEIFKSADCSGSTGRTECAHDSGMCTVRGDSPASCQVVGEDYGGGGEGGSGGVAGGCALEGIEGGSTRFRSVERRPSTRKENGFPPAASTKDSIRDDVQHFPSTVHNNNNSNNHGGNNSNKYRSLVMITQEASYQPVSVITSDTTTLLQPDEVHTASQGLAGYFQLALEAVSEQPHRKNGQGPRKPLMVKRLASVTTNHTEAEVDSGLSIGSASESDDVSVKNQGKLTGRQENNDDSAVKECQINEIREGTRARASSQSSDENSASGVVVILEEGLADDDSWVEEVSHDEDEPGATTATEESSEDEANNLGDREEELRGYHRQAIDFTLHTIVEESCEESEAEPSLATGSPSKKQRPPSASELEKYFFFGLGGDGNNSSMGSREVDSLSETSSIYSEGLESLGQDETPGNGQSQERSNSGEGFLNSSRLEKYFLSEFLGFDQDRRDSDGSVGSDSEGRPSPEAQRKKKLVRARGTGRSHSSSLDNLLALTQSSQNLSLQNSLQDLSLNQDTQETQSEGSSTETDGADDGQTAAFGTDGQFDTVKRKKKKPRNLGTQSPRVPDDRNKTPEPSREMVLVGEVVMENDAEAMNSEDSDRAKTPQPECILSSSSPPATLNISATSASLIDSAANMQMNSAESLTYNQRSKQQSRDSGFVGSCDDLLQHQKLPDDAQSSTEINQEAAKDRSSKENSENDQNASQTSAKGIFGVEKGNVGKVDHPLSHTTLPHLANASLSRKDSFNNWSSDEETNLMMSKMRQFFKTMVANSNGQNQNTINTNSSGASPAPSPRLPGYTSKARLCPQNRTKPPQLVYFENELTRLMKTVPGIRDEQVREIVEYLSSEDTWSDSYDSSDYTSSDLEGAAGGRRSALQEQISQSCQQIISKFDTTSGDSLLDREREDKTGPTGIQAPCLGRDTAFVYQKLVQSFTKMAGDGVSSDANSTPHSSPPLIAKVMHHIGSRLVALMHEVSEGGSAVQHHTTSWRRYSQHHRTPSSASTTEDDDSTSDSTNAPSSTHLQLPRSKSHDPLLLINNHPAASTGQEGEEREASDYERFSWRGSFESALMAADSRTKLSLLACSGDSVGASASANALAMAAKRRSAGDLLFNPKSFSREQLDRVRSCGSIGGGSGGAASGCGGSVEERIWSNRRRSSVPDANTRGESDTSAGDEDTEDELEYTGESRATTLPRGMQSAITAATNSLPRLPASTAPAGLTTTSTTPSSTMHKAHSVYHFLPQHSGVKSARYRPPGFARNSNVPGTIGGPKRAVSAPGLQISGSQSSAGKRDNSRSRRQQTISLTPDDGSSLSEACSTPIIGAGSRTGSSHTVIDVDDMDSGLHSGHLATRASLSSLGARSDSMASVYSGAGEGRCCRSVVVTGEVEFALQYDYKHLTFEVHVTKCKNLAPVDVKRKRSDPYCQFVGVIYTYVKVYLLPDKSKSGKRKTKVKKHTLNPEFNETLKFHMSLSGLETRTLWLTVWHSDMFGRNDFLGEVRMPLENKIFDDPTPKWYPLQERTEPFDDPVAYKGEVIVGLKFVPPDPTQQERDREMGSDRGVSKSKKNWSRGALHVLVKEARNLQTRAKNSGTCDPFCKSYLLPDKGRSGKQKTGVVRKCGGSPVWGHTFIYKDVSLQELAERGLELTVWDHDRIASNEFLGGVRFNLGTGKHYGKPVDWMDATGRELSLWQNMLERPNFWVEGAVTLRPNLHNHGKNSNS